MRKINDTKNIKFERIWAMPNKNTFLQCAIKDIDPKETNIGGS